MRKRKAKFFTAHHGANKADADDGPYAAHVVTTDKTEQTEQRVRERADGAGVSVASGGRNFIEIPQKSYSAFTARPLPPSPSLPPSLITFREAFGMERDSSA